MKPADYDRELADTIYQDIRFAIDGEQFETELHGIDRFIWGWHDDEQEVRGHAQNLANATQQVVEVGVYGFWGHFGSEYVETFKVAPAA